jgi:hypothetical protein
VTRSFKGLSELASISSRPLSLSLWENPTLLIEEFSSQVIAKLTSMKLQQSFISIFMIEKPKKMRLISHIQSFRFKNFLFPLLSRLPNSTHDNNTPIYMYVMYD